MSVPSTSAVALLVNVPVLHGTSYATIPIGEAREFVAVGSGSVPGRIHAVWAKVASGTATFTWEVIAG